MRHEATAAAAAATTTSSSSSPSSVSSPHVNPDDGVCDYYIVRKRRFCRTAKRAGSRFCHTHDTTTVTPDLQSTGGAARAGDAVTLAPQRVPCPINPNHTVYASRLQHHMKVCPDLRFVPHNLPYFSENMHAFRGRMYGAREGTMQHRLTHHDLDVASLARLITRVRECYFTVIQPQIVLLAEENCDASESTVDQTRRQSAKHAPQHRALLRCVERAINGFFDAQGSKDVSDLQLTGFMELGAGKGGLSVALQDALISGSLRTSLARRPMNRSAACEVDCLPRILLVDVDNFRRKGDACMRSSRIPLLRLRVNIKDLDLAKALSVPTAQKHARDDVGSEPTTDPDHVSPSPLAIPTRWVAVGKHLCGACSDFSLSCVTAPNLSTEGQASVVAVVLATCCHQRCELRHLNALQPAENGAHTPLCLPGTAYTISEEEFAAITSMSSWAVSGDVVDHNSRVTGVCCKRIIDFLRLQYLKQCGYRSTYLCEYTSTSITAENTCLVAFR